MVQVKLASTGEMSSFKSCPYKHNPASNLRESLLPNPAGLTSPLLKNFLAKLTALS